VGGETKSLKLEGRCMEREWLIFLYGERWVRCFEVAHMLVAMPGAPQWAQMFRIVHLMMRISLLPFPRMPLDDRAYSIPVWPWTATDTV
jgi:hypothetical protein